MAYGIRSNYVMFDPLAGGSTAQSNPNFVNGRFDPWATSRSAPQAKQNASMQTSGVDQSLTTLADPFQAERAQYQTKLRDLMNNPAGAVESNPFFKASADQGMEAAKRKLAQMGMGDSGNAVFELQKASQANLSDSYFKMADLLSGLSGAKADPSAAASASLGMMKLNEDRRQFDQGPNKFRTIVGGRDTSMPMSSLLGAYRGGY